MYNFKKTEETAREIWKKHEKEIELAVQDDKTKPIFSFLEGPPTANALPGIHHLEVRTFKDIICKFKFMNGFSVPRKGGWDCHGLPAENQVEKELGLKNKKDIGKLGIGKFVKACHNYVDNVSSQWNWYIDRIARWVDMDNPYKTMDLNFMESVIWSFNELYNKGLIYEGYRTSLHCPRCATPLSKFEITMDEGSYKDITEMSVVVKFKLKDSSRFKVDSTFVLAWTTTPWTLPGNLALAINKNVDYILAELNNETYILAKTQAEEILKENYKVLKEFKGKELIGLEYKPLFELNNKIITKDKKVYKIYSEDFVTTDDGTGIVHIAPNFGEEDFESGKRANLPVVDLDRKSTRLNSSHTDISRMPSSA